MTDKTQTLLVGVSEPDCAYHFRDHECGPHDDCCAIWLGWLVPAFGHRFDRVIFTDRFLDAPVAVTAGARAWANARITAERIPDVYSETSRRLGGTTA